MRDGVRGGEAERGRGVGRRPVRAGDHGGRGRRRRVDDERAGAGRRVDVAEACRSPGPRRCARRRRARRVVNGEVQVANGRAVDPALERARLVGAERERRRRVVGHARRAVSRSSCSARRCRSRRPASSGVASTFPAASIARTENVCGPSASAPWSAARCRPRTPRRRPGTGTSRPPREVNVNVGVVSLLGVETGVSVGVGRGGVDRERLGRGGRVDVPRGVAWRGRRRCAAPSPSAAVVNGEGTRRTRRRRRGIRTSRRPRWT